MYNVIWLDTRDGPLVIEIPPNVLGFINDFWSRWVTDVGRPGPDRGAGGRYLLLPPDHAGEVPDGYTVLQSRTCGNKLLFRTFYEDGDLAPAIENAKQNFRVYPLAAAEGERPEMTFVDVSGCLFNNVPNNDVTLFDDVADVVHDEPLEAVDPETRGLLASIGIRKDVPFAPDARMQGDPRRGRRRRQRHRPRHLLRHPRPRRLLLPRRLRGRSGSSAATQTSPPAEYSTSTLARCSATPPRVSARRCRSRWSASARSTPTSSTTRTGGYLDGGKTYRLHLPPDVPVKEFWAVTVYDPQTRSMLLTDQPLPEVSSQMPGTVINPDTSADVYFGPEAPAGHESNWIQTVPGKGWFATMRLYAPLEPWFDKTWRPGEIERID